MPPSCRPFESCTKWEERCSVVPTNTHTPAQAQGTRRCPCHADLKPKPPSILSQINMRRLLFPASSLPSTALAASSLLPTTHSSSSSSISKTSALQPRRRAFYYLVFSITACCCLSSFLLLHSHHGQSLSTLLLPFLRLTPRQTHTVTSVFAAPPEPSSPYSADGYTPDWDRVLAPPSMHPQTIHLNLKRDDVRESLQDLSHIILTTGSLLTSQSAMLPHLSFSLQGIYDLLPDRYLSKPLLIRMGDGVEPAPFPLLSKARVINDSLAVLMPIEYHRHFGFDFQRLIKPEVFGESSSTAAVAAAATAAVAGGGASDAAGAAGDGVDAATSGAAAASAAAAPPPSSSPSSPPLFDPPFQEKAPQALWRGASTGGFVWDPLIPDLDNHRRALIENWGGDVSPKVDVAFTGWCQGAEAFLSHWSAFLKPPLPQAEQLQYRYLISVEGNDVATGLKWMLASNSVVLMPLPRREIWSLEGLLLPWVHFIPVKNDFSDLLIRMEECEKDLERCEEVSERARKYVKSGFGETERTYRQAAARLKEYLDKVTIEIVD